MGVASVDGREDMKADLKCMKLKRDIEDCAEEPVLYGVGEGDEDTCVGVGDNTRCGSRGVTPETEDITYLHSL